MLPHMLGLLDSWRLAYWPVPQWQLCFTDSTLIRFLLKAAMLGHFDYLSNFQIQPSKGCRLVFASPGFLQSSLRCIQGVSTRFCFPRLSAIQSKVPCSIDHRYHILCCWYICQMEPDSPLHSVLQIAQLDVCMTECNPSNERDQLDQFRDQQVHTAVPRPVFIRFYGGRDMNCRSGPQIVICMRCSGSSFKIITRHCHTIGSAL